MHVNDVYYTTDGLYYILAAIPRKLPVSYYDGVDYNLLLLGQYRINPASIRFRLFDWLTPKAIELSDWFNKRGYIS